MEMVITVAITACVTLFVYICFFQTVACAKAKESFYRQCKLNGVKRTIAFSFGYICKMIVHEVFGHHRSKDKGYISIAFFTSGGLGDYIISAKVLEELQMYAPNSRIDVYVEKMSFGDAVFGARENVRVIDSVYYMKRCFRYNLAVNVGHFIKVDEFSQDIVSKYSPELCSRIRSLIEYYKKYYVDIADQCWRERIWFECCRKLNLDRWTEQRMGNAFEIKDKKVFIPLDESYRRIWEDKKYFRHGYITINYGADKMLDGNVKQLKLWGKEAYENLIEIVRRNNVDVRVIQLGNGEAEIIKGCDDYILGESLELTKWILKDSLCHIDCEGGLVHLATQLGTKCIVIFGPTPIHMYGYENNVNLVSSRCNNCMGLHKYWAYDCYCRADGQCMRDITAETVFCELMKIVSSSSENDIT